MDTAEKALELLKLQARTKELDKTFNEQMALMVDAKAKVLKDDDKEKALEAVMIQFKLDDVQKEFKDLHSKATKLTAELKKELKEGGECPKPDPKKEETT